MTEHQDVPINPLAERVNQDPASVFMSLRSAVLDDRQIAEEVLQRSQIPPLRLGHNSEISSLIQRGLAIEAVPPMNNPSAIAYYRLLPPSNPQDAMEWAQFLGRLVAARRDIELEKPPEQRDSSVLSLTQAYDDTTQQLLGRKYQERLTEQQEKMRATASAAKERREQREREEAQNTFAERLRYNFRNLGITTDNESLDTLLVRAVDNIATIDPNLMLPNGTY